MKAEFFAKIKTAEEKGLLLPEAYTNLSLWAQQEWFPVWAMSALQELVAQEAWPELNDRFYKQNEFGTAGIRGRTITKITPLSEAGKVDALGAPEHAAVGSAVMNDFNVLRATIGLFRYAQRYLAQNGRKNEAPKLVIAHDVRHYSRHFTQLTASCWSALGGQAYMFDGPRSTPQLSFTVRYLQAVAGVVITASHNPSHDNGYKVYFEDGSQIVTPHDEGIIAEVNATELSAVAAYIVPNLAKVEVLSSQVDEAYIAALGHTIIDVAALKKYPTRLVYSPVHGTGSVAVLPALARYSVEPVVVESQMSFDGRFPTVKSPNPQNAEALSLGMKKADEVGLDVVLATDPDCDRMGAAVKDTSGQWHVLSGNTIGSLLAEDRLNHLKEKGILPANGHPNAVLIKTFVTTPLQDAIAAAHGVTCINTLTGFKWIGNKLKYYEEKLKIQLPREGISTPYDQLAESQRRELLLKHSRWYVFGGEESYGYLGNDSVRDKDGNAAVLMFAELLARVKAKGKTIFDALAALYTKYGYYAELPLNVSFEGAQGAVKLKKLINSYVKEPPKTIGDFVVRSIRDFAREKIFDADRQEVPSSAVLIFQLDDGTSFAVRPSGTEPNIRYYCFTREGVSEPSMLPVAKQQAETKLQALKADLERDAKERSQ